MAAAAGWCGRSLAVGAVTGAVRQPTKGGRLRAPADGRALAKGSNNTQGPKSLVRRVLDPKGFGLKGYVKKELED
jgi:hypothetical protein